MPPIDPLLAVFLGSVCLAAFVSIYLIAKANIRRRKRTEKVERVAEELGIQISEEELKEIVREEMEKEKSVEEQLKGLAQKEAEKRLKKATRGLHKAKGQKIIVWYDSPFGDSVVTLGKLHSYDRLSFDGHHGYYVLYYFPKHNSVFLNGIQGLIKIIGRGKRRLEVPEELILVMGPKEIIIHAKTLQSIDSNTFRVVPPERIMPIIEENRFLRKAYKAISDLNMEILNDVKKVAKLGIFANPYFRQWYYQQRVYSGAYDEEDEFIPLESRRLREENIRRAKEKLEKMNERLERGERYV